LNRDFKKLLFPTALLALSAQQPVLACATCYGASDSPLAQGMNWGILTLLCVIGAVLTGVAAFFVHVGLKSSRNNAAEIASTEKNP
jgi:hypothetical protein